MPRRAMAQSQVLHQQFSFGRLNFIPHKFSQPKPHFDYDIDAAVASDPLCKYGEGLFSMHSMLQCQFKRETMLKESNWPTQQKHMPERKSPMTVPTSSASKSRNRAHSISRGDTKYGDTSVWSNAVPIEPLIMSNEDTHTLGNNDVVYSHVGKDGLPYFDHSSSWFASSLDRLPRGPSLNGSDLETSSLSPGSYFTENVEFELSSPYPSIYRSPQSHDWAGYSTPYPPIQALSPISAHLGLQPPFSATDTALYSNTANFLFHPHSISGTALPLKSLADATQEDHTSTYSQEGARYVGFENLHLRDQEFDTSPWYLPVHTPEVSGLPFSKRDFQGNGANLSSSMNMFSTNDDQQFPCQLLPWSETDADIPSQISLQNRFPAPYSADAQAQRKINDGILIQGKNDGLTYKEIRSKLVGEKPAESTLRGRFRSLTKARKDRVRKPIWTTRDMVLLNKCVKQEFDRIESTSANPRVLTLKQKLSKVQWKRVADYIEEEGGSYHFGNSTCKRKWLESNKRS